MAQAQAVASDLGLIPNVGDPASAARALHGIYQKEAADPEVQKARADVERTTAEAEKKAPEIESGIQKTIDSMQAGADKKWNADEQLTKYSTPVMQQFGSVGSVFAILASAFTHTPAINALNSSAAAMQAIQKGDAANYEKSYEAWKENTEEALRRNQLQLEGYRAALESLNTEPSLAAARLKAATSKYEDPATQLLAEAGQWDKVYELNNQRAELAAKWQEVHAKTVPYDMLQQWIKEYPSTHGGKKPTPDEVVGQFNAYSLMTTVAPLAATAAGGQQSTALGQDILSATGLDYPTYMVLTGQTTQLPRGKERDRAMAMAGAFAQRAGVDISTFSTEYKAYSGVLQSNIARSNQIRTMEAEIKGTIEQLQPLAQAVASGQVRLFDVGQVMMGQEVNDPIATQYAMGLSQLKEEFAGWNAALRGAVPGAGGGSGSRGVTGQDYEHAAKTILDGLNSGSLGGMKTFVQNSAVKNQTVLKQRIDETHKQIWEMFGVGSKYKSASDPAGDGGGGVVDRSVFAKLDKSNPATGLTNGVPAFDREGNVVARVHDGKWGPP